MYKNIFEFRADVANTIYDYVDNTDNISIDKIINHISKKLEMKKSAIIKLLLMDSIWEFYETAKKVRNELMEDPEYQKISKEIEKREN